MPGSVRHHAQGKVVSARKGGANGGQEILAFAEALNSEERLAGYYA